MMQEIAEQWEFRDTVKRNLRGDYDLLVLEPKIWILITTAL
jgi:hypothetical protein